MCSRIKKLWVGAAVPLIVAGGLAHGQADPRPTAQGHAVLAEILVTATKRAESAQDVPVAVSAVDEATIEALRIDEFTDVARISPSLTVVRGDWATNSGFSLRGIGTNVFSINIEPSVAIVVDDVPLVRSSQAFGDLLDIERIEVLRGPQSTLFGKNASAGVVNVITQDPGNEFNAKLRGGYTTDEQLDFGLTMGGPLGNLAGFRLSGFVKNRKDGHIDNLTTGEEVDGNESWGVRGKLQFDLGESVGATVFAERSESESTCCNATMRSVPADARFLGLLPSAAVLTGLSPAEENTKIASDDLTADESDAWNVGLRLSIDIGEHELLSVTAYNEWDYEVTRDVDGTAFDLLAAFTGGAASGGLVQGGGFELESLSQELRLISPPADSFEYVAGFYYADVDYGRHFQRGPLFAANWVADTGTETLALYGQGTLSVAENTDLVLGARVQDEEISHGFDNALTGASLTGSDSESAATFKAGLQHYVNDDVMVFATVSTGYKGQGYDISSSFNQRTADNPVGNEDSLAFELGMKGTFLDGRLQFNPTLFFATYDDFQAQQARIINNLIELGIANVGELETYGVEVDFQAALTENLRVVGGLALIKAEIKEFPGADCWVGQTSGCIEIRDSAGMGTGRSAQDLGGEDLNNSPDFKFTVSAEYLVPFENLPFDGFVNLSYQWQDDVNFSLLADPGAKQDAYGIANLSLGIIESRSERYSVTLFVNNLFDEDYVTNIANFGGLWGNAPTYIQTFPRDAERYAGIQLGVRF
ncbi:MAG: TonB-dependent receptor [Gammaproteobacteria bacterium]|nr:TonB-dependent receptor [Gammaproteobacteria bacterium]